MNGFRPARWLPGGHLQTLFSPLLRRRPQLPRQRQRLALSDGDFLDLDWYGPESTTGPCIILLHGLTGSAESPYILGQQQALAARGWRSVAVNWRGCSGEPNQRARSYHSGASDDLAEVVGHLRQQLPQHDLAAVGYSLGGNVLLKYLGECGADCPLQAAAAVSVPFRLDQCADRIGEGFSRVYQARFLRDLLAYVANKRRLFAHHSLSAEQARLDALGTLEGMDSLWDFDDRVTAPLHGFASAADYYQRCSSRFFLAGIQVPTLIVQALNDPFVYPHSVPELAELSASTRMELHPRGGHVGFIEGPPWRPGYYLERRLPEWLAQQLG
ncbi:hydrolase [Halopseudomonas phragmitis]|uniref:Hydrolase n=1 Tax=Halopseudomonas phragmitis TaxID=1931241 RepID=A0A1V0B2V3_9GAMM|nr:hydrolase [Halopseudomonas phragmitis]AQZ94266.1 hydrolase [Halopseudomonas phragmitis]